MLNKYRSLQWIKVTHLLLFFLRFIRRSKPSLLEHVMSLILLARKILKRKCAQVGRKETAAVAVWANKTLWLAYLLGRSTPW